MSDCLGGRCCWIASLTCGGGDGGPFLSRSLLDLDVPEMEDAGHRLEEGLDLVGLHAQGGHGFLRKTGGDLGAGTTTTTTTTTITDTTTIAAAAAATTTTTAHVCGSKFLCIVHIIDRDLSVLHKVVALDLAGEQELIEQLLVGTGQQLVEDVVAPLPWLLGDHSGLLQKIWTITFDGGKSV